MNFPQHPKATARTALLAGAFALFMQSCALPHDGGFDPDSSNEQSSSILPMEPTIPKTSPIGLFTPSYARTLPAGARIAFQFQTSGYKNGILVILKAPPDLANGVVTNLVKDCAAGAASLAGHVFDGSLGVDSSRSDLYACTGNPSAPFSRETKVKSCPPGATCPAQTSLQAGRDYWWFILGYDEKMVPTHSSPAFKFTLKG
ncbi:MAG: hypothetical protein H6686_12545 [Fibrobacteria bacterium]|nr:hypothetical protein [Fibrobacteria bacterium]